MKVGFVFECGPQGADLQVCEYLARKIRPEITPVSRTLSNKDDLLKEAGRVAALLLAEGCERVLVVWDLRPAWPDMDKKPCRREERAALLEAIASAQVASHRVFLVCVEQELESWLLADETKMSAYLSTATRPYKAKKVKKPDEVKNPKSVMIECFKEARGRRYEDRTDAIKLLRVGETNLQKLRRSPSFERFESKLKQPVF
ncbi:DUF4276 family protein [uncultured Thiodictyon sp.]|uniref:DUF4276 family protein n=1 Tax=uncultured Thiodictyon sp. TaxID=1846217 RepID=UPI0025D4E11F|nr:DUF4276 family protein [uncultured Thiodictyon sp.]